GRGGVADATAGQFINDVYAVMKSGWAKLRIQNRDYVLDGPLQVFPPCSRLAGVAAVTTNLTTGAATYSEIDYATAAGVPYQLVGVWIQPNQSFTVQANWGTAVALPS